MILKRGMGGGGGSSIYSCIWVGSRYGSGSDPDMGLGRIQIWVWSDRSDPDMGLRQIQI